jgi:hypothetical protein
MADDSDILLKLFEEEWVQARQAEEQRTAFTNIVLIIASIVLGMISQSSLSKNVLPLTLLLAVLGIYGAVTSQKLYERHRFFVDRSRYWRKKLDELHPKLQIEKLRIEANAEHRKNFPRLEKMRLNILWLFLHITIAIAGIVLTILIIAK